MRNRLGLPDMPAHIYSDRAVECANPTLDAAGRIRNHLSLNHAGMPVLFSMKNLLKHILEKALL
jgi:hypothetical protein